MSETRFHGSGCGVIHHGNRGPAAFGLADWLGLAAAPTFAIMALLSGLPGGGAADMVCSAAHGSALGGMVPMYVLMSAFHSAPWLKLLAGRRNRARPTTGRATATPRA